MRWRITLASATLTFIILLIFGVVVGNMTASRVRSDFNRDLIQSASGLASRSRIVEHVLRSPTVSAPDLSQAPLPPNAIAQVVTLEGTVADRVPPTENAHFGPLKPGVADLGSMAVATVPITGPESETVGFVQYGRPTDSVESTIAKLWIFIVGGVLGGTALAVLAGLALANRAMRPISLLTATAREVATTQDPSQRIPTPSADDEVGELARTLQEMLTSLDEARAARESTLQKQRDFVADASHELRTPLTSILANLELHEAQSVAPADSEEREIINSAVRATQRLSRLVSQLLFLAKSDAGRQKERADCDLAAIAMSAAREITPNLGGRTLDTAGCNAVMVLGNQDDLHRLILNLLDNAVRYTPEDAWIGLSTQVEGEMGVIEVADDGPGIPPEMRESVFERFVRGSESSDVAKADGTGLGLAMVRAIATDHDGTVVAKASQSGGAAIRIKLPRRAATSNQQASPADGRAAERPSDRLR